MTRHPQHHFLASELIRHMFQEGTHTPTCIPQSLKNGLYWVIVLLIKENDEGSTCMDIKKPSHQYLRDTLESLEASDAWEDVSSVLALLSQKQSPQTSLFDPAPDSLLGWVSHSPDTPLFVEHGLLSTQKLAVLERELLHLIQQRGSRTASELPASQQTSHDLLRAATFPGAFEPSKEQRAAIHTSLNAPLSLVTGGPGTGKTALIASLIQAHILLGIAPEDIAVATPTGKAADRIHQSFHDLLTEHPQLPPPQTLHRLLGYQPQSRSCHHHAINPLPHRLIIVDEASMIGLHMMHQLFSSIHKDSKLVLVGDAEQLPPVDPGDVFRTLCAIPSHAVPITHLSINFRVDPASTQLAQLAVQVSQGTSPDLSGSEVFRWVTTPSPDMLRTWGSAFHSIPNIDLHRNPNGNLTISSKEEVILREALRCAHLKKILCPMHQGPFGTETINAFLQHQRFVNINTEASFFPGDPVMVVNNDYPKELFNGDQGVAFMGHLTSQEEPLATQESLFVAFERPSGLLIYPLHDLKDNLALAYAISIHKSQGSEYDDVMVVLPDTKSVSQKKLVTKELLYTAVTRAKKSLSLLGPRSAVALAIANRTQRQTLFRHLWTEWVKACIQG